MYCDPDLSCNQARRFEPPGVTTGKNPGPVTLGREADRAAQIVIQMVHIVDTHRLQLEMNSHIAWAPQNATHAWSQVTPGTPDLAHQPPSTMK